MVSKSKVSFVGLGLLFFTFVALLLLFSSVIMQEHSDSAGTENIGCYYGEMDLQNRKLLSEKQLPARTGGLLHAITSGNENMMVGGSELRVVPSGPDPLHHNGSPKKPRTP
ncbi:protein CLAVATA 3 [Citrus sinensis]|uniref:protein CLAVATA 3 n=1 Tax=Citrus sinensis TaxID=2711 RepID=UPI002279CDE7|nr:protein CLAVATA 3 [Citrus sinensis]